MVRTALPRRDRGLAGGSRGAPGREPLGRRNLQRQLHPSGLPVPAGHRGAATARSAGRRLQQSDRPARRPAAAHGPRRPDVHRRRRPGEAAARPVRAEPAVRPLRLRPVGAERRTPVLRRTDGVHHGPLRRAALDPGRRLSARGGRRRTAAAGRGRAGRVRRTTGRAGPSRARRPDERADRVRRGDRGPADRLRQCARRRHPPPDGTDRGGRRSRRARTAGRGVHLRHGVTDPGDDDRPRCRHRLRAVPDHPVPAGRHGRRGSGAGGRSRHLDERTCGAGLRLYGDHRAGGSVRVRGVVHLQAGNRRGRHRRLRRRRGAHPGARAAGSDRPAHRPLAGAPSRRGDRRRVRCRAARHLAPVRPAGGSPSMDVPRGGRGHDRRPRRPGVLDPAGSHRGRRGSHVLHGPARLRPDDRRVRCRLQRSAHRRHRPVLRTGLRAFRTGLAGAADPGRRGGGGGGHAAHSHPGRRRAGRHGVLVGLTAEFHDHRPRQPPGGRHPAGGRAGHGRADLRHRDYSGAGRLP